MQLRYFVRLTTNYLSYFFATIATLFGVFFLIWILFTLFQKGLAGINLTTFTQMTEPPQTNGGLLNAIIGSFLITAFAILLGTPIGMLAGTYLAEFGKHSGMASIIRFTNDVLLSVPSIIVGLFIYQIYVVHIQHFSGLAGSFALGILVIPVVTRTTENIFSLIPNSLREAARALGAPEWKIICFILLRVARTGILTGILLAMARISGETAPLLFTTLNNQFWNLDMNQSMANLPIVIFQYAMSPYPDWHVLAWAGALIITLWILIIYIVVRILFKQKPPLV